MFLIFSGSGEVLSFNQTSRFLGPFLQWIFPGIAEPELRTLMFVIRKGGHVTEYAILAMLLWAAIRTMRSTVTYFWQDARWAAIIAVLYAISDEVHQSLVPSRQGAWQDVVIDTAGALAGLTFLWMIVQFRKRRSIAPDSGSEFRA